MIAGCSTTGDATAETAVAAAAGACTRGGGGVVGVDDPVRELELLRILLPPFWVPRPVITERQCIRYNVIASQFLVRALFIVCLTPLYNANTELKLTGRKTRRQSLECFTHSHKRRLASIYSDRLSVYSSKVKGGSDGKDGVHIRICRRRNETRL